MAPFVLIPEDSWIWRVIVVDAALLANRCVQRAVSIARISSARQAALSLPRIIWGNLINFFAVAKATRLFVHARLTGQKPVWVKTAHAFPTEEQLIGFKRKLGDLLLESRLLTLAHLTEALEVQKESDRLLGDVLVGLGYVQEDDVVKTLGSQLKVETRRLDAALNCHPLELISEAAAREHLMVIADASQNPVVIAAADVRDKRMRNWLDANFSRPYRLVLAGRRNIVDIIDRAAQSADRPSPPFRRPPGDGPRMPLN